MLVLILNIVFIIMGSSSEKRSRKIPPSKKQKALKRSRAHRNKLTKADLKVTLPILDAKKSGIVRKNSKSCEALLKSCSSFEGVTSGESSIKTYPEKGSRSESESVRHVTLDTVSQSSGQGSTTESTVSRKFNSPSKVSTENNPKGETSSTSNEGETTPKTTLVNAGSVSVAPLQTVKSSSSSVSTSVCPVFKRKLNAHPSPSCYSPEFSSTRSQSAPSSKILEIQRYIPVLSYPSTVVTMTNNMSAIRQHSSLDGDKRKPNEKGSQKPLFQLINNVLQSEQQITNVFASVNNQVKSSVNVTREEGCTSQMPLNVGKTSAIDCLSEARNVPYLCSGTCDCEPPTHLVPDRTVEYSDVQPGKSAYPDPNTQQSKNGGCHFVLSKTGKLAVPAADDDMGSRQMNLSVQDLNTYAKLLWLSELKSDPAGSKSKKATSKMWKELPEKEKQPYISRARKAMADPSLETIALQNSATDQKTKSRKRVKPNGSLGKIKIGRRVEGSREAKSAVPKDMNNTLVLTVTHPPTTTILSATSKPTPSCKPATQTMSQSILIADKSDQPKMSKCWRSSANSTQLVKEDYGGCQQAQQFYSMTSAMQKSYLERELHECRKIMSKSQCRSMLNGYKDEYKAVSRSFLSVNNLMSSRTQKENLEVIQRSILYNKLSYHKQQAIITNAYLYPTGPQSVESRFNSLVDYILETGMSPPTTYTTYSPDLTLLLDVIESVPVNRIEPLPLAARESESYLRILGDLLDDRTSGSELDMISASDCDSLLSECELPTLLSLSDSALQLHLDS